MNKKAVEEIGLFVVVRGQDNVVHNVFKSLRVQMSKKGKWL
jgi:hypothetical protein